MSTTRTQHLVITDGPTANVIWTAAQYAYSQSVKVTVDFTLNQRFPQPEGVMWQHIFPRITGAIHQDGSGQEARIFGYLNSHNYFTGFYNARSRKGWIDVGV